MDYTTHELNGYDRAQNIGPGRLPDPPTRTPGEPVVYYGARVLQFLIASECTAVLSDESLALAEHAAVYAVASHDISPEALTRINRIRHLIALILRFRAIGATEINVPDAAPQHAEGSAPVPIHPVPLTQPPAAGKVLINF